MSELTTFEGKASENVAKEFSHKTLFHFSVLGE